MFFFIAFESNIISVWESDLKVTPERPHAME